MTITFSDTSYIEIYRDGNMVTDCENISHEQFDLATELFMLTEKQNETNDRTT